MKCAGPVACSNEATWWVETTDREAGLHHKMPRCDRHILRAVMGFLQRRSREEVRLVPVGWTGSL